MSPLVCRCGNMEIYFKIISCLWLYLSLPPFPLKCKRSHTPPVWIFCICIKPAAAVMYRQTSQTMHEQKMQSVALPPGRWLKFKSSVLPPPGGFSPMERAGYCFPKRWFWRWRVHMKWNPQQPQTSPRKQQDRPARQIKDLDIITSFWSERLDWHLVCELFSLY